MDDNRVTEYNGEGAWCELRDSQPWAAVRLANGNT